MQNSINVLDRGFVRLVDVMGNDLKTAAAARISFRGAPINLSDELQAKDEKLIEYLAAHGHTSPFRSNLVTLHFKAPLYIARQAWKHVVSGGELSFRDTQWNEVSGRYTTTSLEFHMPDVWRRQSSDNKQASDGLIEKQEEADQAYHYGATTAVNTYNQLIAAGVAREQARTVLPQSMYTEWWWTASLQAVAHFYKLRAHSHSQLEMQEYAAAVGELVGREFPVSWEALTKDREGDK